MENKHINGMKCYLRCYRDPPVHHHFHESNQEMCVWATWNIAQQVFSDVQILLYNAKQYSREVWAKQHMVMKLSGSSLYTCLEDSVFIFKACKKINNKSNFFLGKRTNL